MRNLFHVFYITRGTGTTSNVINLVHLDVYPVISLVYIIALHLVGVYVYEMCGAVRCGAMRCGVPRIEEMYFSFICAHSSTNERLLGKSTIYRYTYIMCMMYANVCDVYSIRGHTR